VSTIRQAQRRARPQPQSEAKYNHETAAQELLDRVRTIAAICDPFPLAQPAVVSVCLGARSAKQLQRNVALYGKPIPADLSISLQLARGLKGGCRREGYRHPSRGRTESRVGPTGFDDGSDLRRPGDEIS
jgi:hypothetical protein